MAADDTRPHAGLDARERKQMLIAQGQLFRLGLLDASQDVRSGLQVEQLARNAVGHLASNGFSMLEQVLGAKAGSALLLKLLLPLAGSGLSLLMRQKHRLRPRLGSVLVLGGAAAAGFLAWRWISIKRRRGAGAGRT